MQRACDRGVFSSASMQSPHTGGSSSIRAHRDFLVPPPIQRACAPAERSNALSLHQQVGGGEGAGPGNQDLGSNHGPIYWLRDHGPISSSEL